MPKRPTKRAVRKLTPFKGLAVAVAISIMLAGELVGMNAFAAAPSVSSPNTRAALAVAQLHGWFNSNTYATTGWWQSANALGAEIDYMQVTGSRAYLGDVQSFYAAHQSTNFIINKYYDDEGWWAQTWIKAYNLTGNVAYLNTSKAIFANMTGGWDSTCGGGLWWTTDKTYKNAIPNELFLNIATQLHTLTPKDTAYENWAAKEWTWFKGSTMISTSNLVYDGLGAGCKANSTSTTWTYNQGVILSGLVNQYRITGDSSLLPQAESIASAVIASSSLSPNGILTEPCEPKGTCGSDNAMFKGIFMADLGVLTKQTGITSYAQYLQQNANSMWGKDVSGGNQLGLHWAGPFDSADAARQASALDLLNTQAQPQGSLTTASPTSLYSGLSGLCLDDRTNSTANLAVVQTYACNGTAAQHWTVTASGLVQINGKCLDIYQNGTANGSKVDLYTCNGGQNQHWQLSTSGTLTNPQSGKCLDVPNASTANSTQLQIYTCNGNTQQLWYPAS